MKRRILALALCVLALISVLPPGAAAGTEATFVVEAPETLPAVGEEFTVTVKLENNPGFGGIQFTLDYDQDAFACTEIRQGDMLAGTFSGNNRTDAGVILVAADSEPVTSDGVLLTLTLRMEQVKERFDGQLVGVILNNTDREPLEYSVKVATVQTPNSRPSSGDTTTPPKPTDKPDPSDKPEPKPEDKPEPKPTPVTFTDLEGHWGKDFAEKAAQAGLFKGYPDGSFHPDEAVSRAQFVTVLWRLAGAPAEEGTTPFADIADQYIDFQKAIAWGYHQGYVKGMAENVFAPDKTLTRQEAMTILFRYAGEQSGMELMFTSIYDSQFQDSAEIAPWARSAMYWGVYNTLIQGTGGGVLSPTGTASRVQIAKIMTQYQDNIRKEEQ